MTQNEIAGRNADEARKQSLAHAQHVQELKRKIAAVELKKQTAGQVPEEVGQRLQRLQKQVDDAAERFVHGLWSNVHSARVVAIDFTSSDAVAYFQYDTITAKLPELVDRFMSRDMRGSRMDAAHVAAIVATCDIELAALRQELAKLGMEAGT